MIPPGSADCQAVDEGGGVYSGLCATALIMMAIAWCHPDTAVAQKPTVWGDLEPGPYSVGYLVQSEIDHSRAYRPAVNWLGDSDSLETGRPMQISIWYPTDEAPDVGASVTFGDYVRTQAGALGPSYDTDERRREFERALTRGPLSPFFEGDVPESELQRILATPMAAVRGAHPAHGRFPVVIHGGFSLIGQTVLLEYLASHGFVVLSVPLLGTAPAWFMRGQGTPEWYQAGADDVGYLHAFAYELDFADASQTAMIGMFSAFGLLYQMQHMQLDAFVSLDGSYPPALRSVPGFDSVAVRIPILDMPRSDVGGDRSILDGLRYADRYLVDLDEVTHGDFYQFQRVAYPARAREHAPYRVIAHTTRKFLNHVFHDDLAFTAGDLTTGAISDANHGIRILHLQAEPAIPTADEFLLLIREARFEEARRAWQRIDCPGPSCAPANEGDITIMLRFLRRDGGAEVAVDGFELLVDMFPNSSSARQHLQETVEAARTE